MNLASSIKSGITSLRNTMYKESPTIFSGLAITGVFTTTGFAVDATLKAQRVIDREHYERQDDEPFSKKETLGLVWKYYIPTVISGITTVSFIVLSNSINLRRTAAITGLYEVTQKSLKEYQKKVVETLGENKANKIDEALAQDKLDNNPVTDREVLVTSNGDALFFDTMSGRYFRSSIEFIRKTVNDFNQELLSEMYMPLNDLYYKWNLKPVKIGNDTGWNIDDGLLEVSFTAKIADSGEPCIVLNYDVCPRKL